MSIQALQTSSAILVYSELGLRHTHDQWHPRIDPYPTHPIIYVCSCSDHDLRAVAMPLMVEAVVISLQLHVGMYAVETAV